MLPVVIVDMTIQTEYQSFVMQFGNVVDFALCISNEAIAAGPQAHHQAAQANVLDVKAMGLILLEPLVLRVDILVFCC